MGFRYHRSWKIAPGIRVNLSKSGPSLSVGGKGFHENIGLHGTRTTFSLPGTGLSYQTRHSYHSHHKTAAGYAIAFRQKGTDGPLMYIGSDSQEVHDTPDKCAPLSHVQAEAVKQSLEGMDPPAECRIVKLDMRARQRAEDTRTGAIILLGLAIGFLVFLAMVVAANAATWGEGVAKTVPMWVIIEPNGQIANYHDVFPTKEQCDERLAFYIQMMRKMGNAQLADEMTRGQCEVRELTWGPML